MLPTLAILGLAVNLAQNAAAPGTYVSGDGLGFNWTLDLDRRGRFKFLWTGCLGTYDENAGRMRMEGSWLILEPEKPRDSGVGRQLPLRWLVLQWGRRHYLIADDELEQFVREVNAGHEPRHKVHGSVLLRENDWRRPASGSPTLPEPWSSLLREVPVSARVTAVRGDGVIAVEPGTETGFAPGLPVYVLGPETFTWGRVATVSADIIHVHLAHDGDTVKVGDLVSTRLSE